MDLKETFKLPSGGKIYDKEIQTEYTIRAPRLCDKGIGDTRKKNKVQSEVLMKCLEPKPEINPYDWHTSDYTAANLAQRIAARGNIMELGVRCGYCKTSTKTQVDLDKVKINPPKLPFDLSYKMASGEEVQLRYFTPRILDSLKDKVEQFKKDFPEATQDVSLQESVRAVIVSIDGEKLTYSQMTTFLLNSYEVDLLNIIDKVISTNFGPELTQKIICPNCGEEIVFSISPDNG